MIECNHEPTIMETSEGQRYCRQCAGKFEQERFKDATKYFAYLDGDGKRITTWTGAELARVLYVHPVKLVGFGGYYDAVTVNAMAPDGSVWSGRGPGKGMYVRLKRTKQTLGGYRVA